jgi:hypothetical protein
VTHGRPRASRFRWGARFGAAVLLPLACAYPLLEDEDEDDGHAVQAVVVASAGERTRGIEPELAVTESVSKPAPEPEPAPEPPRAPPTPEQLSAWLDEAAVALEQLEIKTDPRRRASGPMPDDSGLREAYVDGRAMVLEGRLEQVRQWMAQAKFGSREPGPRAGSSALSRYDLVVTRDAGRKKGDVAYFHVVVPAVGLPAPGETGEHAAWIDEQRWINLADVLDPTRDYVPFKSNGTESLHRQWAKVDVVESIVDIARDYTQQTGLPLGIGDLSHVTGGKIEDHWTHQDGVDVDLYVLDPRETDADGRPQIWWCHVKRKGPSPIWTSKPLGKGEHEPSLEPEDELSHTATSKRLEVLAQIVFLIDEVAYFVHNDTRVLDPFDDQVGERRPGRRFLHAGNRGYWPTHADHVHLRWVEGKLPVGVTPRP